MDGRRYVDAIVYLGDMRLRPRGVLPCANAFCPPPLQSILVGRSEVQYVTSCEAAELRYQPTRSLTFCACTTVARVARTGASVSVWMVSHRAVVAWTSTQRVNLSQRDGVIAPTGKLKLSPVVVFIRREGGHF